MNREKEKRAKWVRRVRRIRKRVSGTPQRPRLAVHRSLRNIEAQLVDDLAGRTLVSVSTLEKDLRSRLPRGGNTAAASAVGRCVAERARALGIERVVFDRRGHLYHGRIKALAVAAREGGLKF
ncbi:MAG: 50S ribosomal protein L18 [Planctomycetes bacterium]|nr:50S ribosomal protein L18 [Planctomycetota bacterium]